MIPPQNVPDEVYYRESRKRMGYCIEADRCWDNPRHQKVALMVLSCKRPGEFQRLCESLAGMLPWEPCITSRWLVDNGSGEGLIRYAGSTGLFTHVIAHPVNLGIGEALNRVLDQVNSRYILFIEDDLVLDYSSPWVEKLCGIFDEYPQVGIIKLKRRANWDDYPFRRIGPIQTTTTGVRFHPWLSSPRWSFRWGQRPWYPVGTRNVWSLGPVMFRHAIWRECGPIPTGQGRGQAVAAEEEYARRVNQIYIAARPCDFHPFSQPPTTESPGFKDVV